ncbi:hypothetical protein C8R47DRAFT_719718 [Mycena vitilis]|nr:hypothetical protein C8R47DRAFT_719718 [Mycena vitilis]
MAHLEPVFPPELEREIFSTTALMYPKEIPSLLRVAHRVLIWIEPMMYRIIYMVGNPGMARALLYAMSAKPAGFFRAVRHLHLDLSDDAEPNHMQLLQLCEECIDLIIRPRCLHPALLPILAQMRVQRLGTNLGVLFRGSIDLQHDMFTSITHLDMFGVEGVVDALPELPTLHALTHLCLDPDIPRNNVLATLSGCPRLKILLVQWPSGEDDEYAEAQIPTVYDVRFVIGIYDDYWGEWAAGAKGSPDMWSIAEDFVARKRKGEVESTRFWLD